MSPLKTLRLFCALAFAAVSLSPCWSEPEGKARAQVFTRELATGERIEFSWDSHEKVPFSIGREGDKILLHFERPVKLRWGATLDALRPYVQQVESSEGGATITLTLSEPFRADYYRTDNDRIVDDDRNGINLIRTSEQPSAPVTPLTLPEEQPDVLHVHKQAPHKPDKTKKLQRNKKVQQQARQTRKPGDLAKLSPTAGAPSAPTQAPAPPATSSQAGGPPVPQPLTTTPASSLAPGSAALALPYKSDDPFAVFEWQKKLWIVSESPAAPSTDDLKKQGAPFVKDVQTLSDSHATVLALPLDGDISATVEKTSSGQLQVLLRHGASMLNRQLIPSLKASAGKKSLVIATGAATHNLSIRDPQTGFILDVVPVADPGAGIATPRSFVEFNLLKSAQGIAIQRISDDISISVQKGVTEIASAGGLAISPELARQIAEAEAEAKFAHLAPTLFPYVRWKLEDKKDFVPTQIRLLHDIVYSSPDEANKARLKLLDLYLGEGLFPEAVGMSDDILRSSLKFYQANKVSALRGAAYLFMYRFSEAERDFSAAELGGDPEVQMWHTLCSELLGNGTATFDFSANYNRYISHYPPGFIEKLAIIAADRSISRKQYDAATLIFDTLKHDGFDEPVKKYIDYMQAKILSETHSETEAAAIWAEQAKQLDDPLIRARAEFSLVNMLLRQGKISHEEAERRLERLRIVWRGDSLELSVLTLLGNLYLQGKQYDKALRTLRDVVLYFPQVPEAVTAARKMEEAFVALYNKGAADDLPPLEALSLFYEFHDLVPIGKDGDLMIRNLADRLVNIDLLDRAAQLLDHQIRNRLDGEERSRVGAQLAQIYLLNHKPDSALDTLKTTGYGDLPPDLQLKRLRLTAEALAQQGKVARAIEVISTDNSPDGTLLRLSIYWDNKDWPNVVTIAEDILGNRNDPSASLSKQESEVLLKLATAYVYEHDTGQLQYLRDYFTPLMKNNPNQSSFLFITSESGTIDYDNLANLDTDIGAVKSFLNNNTQEKLGKNGMSPNAAN